MSVINQMLKDLAQRTTEQDQAPIARVLVQKPSTLKIVLISMVVLLSLNALAFYLWGLPARPAKNLNQQSLSQQDNQQPLQAENKPVQIANIAPQEKEKAKAPAQESSLSVEPNKQNQAKQAELTRENIAVTSPAVKPAVKPAVTSVVAVKKSPVDMLIVEAPVLAPAKMSVSRRQLTSKELVAQKLARAEKSVNMNDIAKAEQLFEEILIIEPEHKQARKNLAALWFGRKSYQQALNLLSQGIAIDNQDGELRLLKARIHLQQGQQQAAYNTLKSLAAFEHEEYQVMLANIAQQIEQYTSAISAYKVLIAMQPYSGRWHLGLAIVYDKNSQFTLASHEYALALTKADLSVSSAKFAEQRLQVLGE